LRKIGAKDGYTKIATVLPTSNESVKIRQSRPCSAEVTALGRGIWNRFAEIVMGMYKSIKMV
jgi:hypothetical protein